MHNCNTTDMARGRSVPLRGRGVVIVIGRRSHADVPRRLSPVPPVLSLYFAGVPRGTLHGPLRARLTTVGRLL